MVVVCAPNHPLATASSLAIEQLDGQEMVGFVENLRIRRETDKVLSAHGVSVHVVMEFDNIETLKRAVEINAGFSLLPEPTVVREVQLGSLVAIPLASVKMVRPLGILHRRGVDLGRDGTRRFIQFLLDYPKADEWSAHAARPASRSAGSDTKRTNRRGQARHLVMSSRHVVTVFVDPAEQNVPDRNSSRAALTRQSSRARMTQTSTETDVTGT